MDSPSKVELRRETLTQDDRDRAFSDECWNCGEWYPQSKLECPRCKIANPFIAERNNNSFFAASSRMLKESDEARSSVTTQSLRYNDDL